MIDEILPNGDINVTFSDGFDGTAIWDFSPHELQKIQDDRTLSLEEFARTDLAKQNADSWKPVHRKRRP